MAGYPYPVGPGQWCPGVGVSGPSGMETCSVPPKDLAPLTFGPMGTIVPSDLVFGPMGTIIGTKPPQATPPAQYAPTPRLTATLQALPAYSQSLGVPVASGPQPEEAPEALGESTGVAGMTFLSAEVDAYRSPSAAEAIRLSQIRGDNIVRGVFGV